MSAYELLLLLHILLFVYWLGGDLGVFYSSGFVVDSSLSNEARLTAAKIMMGCDLVPRICMSLMLTIGGLLSATIGVEHFAWQTIALILLAPFWLTMVLVLHFRHHETYIAALTKFDFFFRCFLIFAIIVSCTYAFFTGRLADSQWLIAKILGFALLVFCGLMIRVNFKDFGAVYGKLTQGNQSEEDNQLMRRSLGQIKPWVITIWGILVIEAWLGIAKPF